MTNVNKGTRPMWLRPFGVRGVRRMMSSTPASKDARRGPRSWVVGRTLRNVQLQKRNAGILPLRYAQGQNDKRKRLQGAHVVEELLVVAGLGGLVCEKLHGVDRRERVDDAAEDPGALEVFLGDQQLFLTRAGALDVDGREDALVDQLAVEDDFHVAGTLELFEDDLVHARAGVDEGGGDNC